MEKNELSKNELSIDFLQKIKLLGFIFCQKRPTYEDCIDWLYEKHKVKLDFRISTSGKHNYDIWVWDINKVCWYRSYNKNDEIYAGSSFGSCADYYENKSIGLNEALKIAELLNNNKTINH